VLISKKERKGEKELPFIHMKPMIVKHDKDFTSFR
jgi:hypothetical protein